MTSNKLIIGADTYVNFTFAAERIAEAAAQEIQRNTSMGKEKPMESISFHTYAATLATAFNLDIDEVREAIKIMTVNKIKETENVR